MSTRVVTKVDRVPGRLFKAPTTTSGAAPYGGVELGAARGIDVELIAPVFQIPAEEYGGAPADAVEGGRWLLLYVHFRQFDVDAVATMFPNTTTGVSGEKIITEAADATVRAGHLMAESRGVKLLFVPNDVTTQRSLVLYRALPVLVADARIGFTSTREANIEASFLAMPDATKRIYQSAILSELTL